MIVLIGEAPGKLGVPGRPLPATRVGSAGHRLREMASLTQEVWDVTPRLNIVPFYPGSKYPSRLARANAECLSHSVLRYSVLVLLGRKTASAFGLRPTDYAWCERVKSPFGPTCYVIPHPSGLCREYNDPKMRKRVGKLVARLLKGAQT